MINIEEFSTERKQMLTQKGIVFASSSEEVEALYESETGTWYRSLINGAYQVDRVISRWSQTHIPNWSVLNGAAVLDIASGSAHRWASRAYSPDPHFARFCAVSGADVTVIDRF